jgi:hypothetical protein
MPSSLTEINPRALFTMLKGEPGTRKSTAALSYLPAGKQYWFSWDQKMTALLLPASKWGYDLSQVDYDDYDDWDKAKAKLKEFQVSMKGYKTLVFDSVTTMADSTLRQQRTNKSKDGQGKKLGTIEVDGIEEYNAESAAIGELIAMCKDIKKFHKVNIILIAHVVQAEYRNTTTNTTHVSRTIVTAGKKIAAKLPAICEEVYHFNIKKGIVESQGGKYTCLTTHTGDDFARTILPVASEIEMGDKPLYSEFLLPGINSLIEIQEKAKAAKAAAQVSSGSSVSSSSTSKFTT